MEGGRDNAATLLFLGHPRDGHDRRPETRYRDTRRPGRTGHRVSRRRLRFRVLRHEYRPLLAATAVRGRFRRVARPHEPLHHRARDLAERDPLRRVRDPRLCDDGHVPQTRGQELVDRARCGHRPAGRRIRAVDRQCRDGPLRAHAGPDRPGLAVRRHRLGRGDHRDRRRDRPDPPPHRLDHPGPGGHRTQLHPLSR